MSTQELGPLYLRHHANRAELSVVAPAGRRPGRVVATLPLGAGRIRRRQRRFAALFHAAPKLHDLAYQLADRALTGDDDPLVQEALSLLAQIDESA